MIIIIITCLQHTAVVGYPGQWVIQVSTHHPVATLMPAYGIFHLTSMISLALILCTDLL